MLNGTSGNIQWVGDRVIFSQHNFTAQGPTGGKKERPLHLLVGKVVELFLPGQPQHCVDVDHA